MMLALDVSMSRVKGMLVKSVLFGSFLLEVRGQSAAEYSGCVTIVVYAESRTVVSCTLVLVYYVGLFQT